jgi:hypothetical protein
MEAKLYQVNFHQGEDVKTLWEVYILQIGIAINEQGECRRCKFERVRALNQNLIDVDVSYDFTVTVDKFMRIKEDLMQATDEEFKDLIEEYGSEGSN